VPTPAPHEDPDVAATPRPFACAGGNGVEAAHPRVERPWLVLWATLLVSVAAVMPQFAAPPLMPVLMANLGIDIGRAGSLMSVFSVAGLLLALPAGLLLARFGPRRTVSAAIVSAAAGCLLAATTSDFAVLLISRVVQGVGVGLVGVAAPTVVASAFTADRRGTPMGVWATWVPLGAIAMYVAAPPVAEAAGWQAVFAACALASVLALVVFLAATVQAAGVTASQVPASRADSWLGQALASRGIWLLVVVLAA
jgi:MFS family permease